MECPECGKPMELIEAEPDIGILSSGWFCEACEIIQDAEEDEGMPGE